MTMVQMHASTYMCLYIVCICNIYTHTCIHIMLNIFQGFLQVKNEEKCSPIKILL